MGYLNLRGRLAIDDLIAPWNPAVGQGCCILVGMQRPPHEEIRELYSLNRQTDEPGLIENANRASAMARLPMPMYAAFPGWEP